MKKINKLFKEFFTEVENKIENDEMSKEQYHSLLNDIKTETGKIEELGYEYKLEGG